MGECENQHKTPRETTYQLRGAGDVQPDAG